MSQIYTDSMMLPTYNYLHQIVYSCVNNIILSETWSMLLTKHTYWCTSINNDIMSASAHRTMLVGQLISLHHRYGEVCGVMVQIHNCKMRLGPGVLYHAHLRQCRIL